jgi:hypothetical protein
MALFGPPNVDKMKARKDVKGLIKALGYREDAGVRRAAAQVLGELGDVRAVEPLIAVLEDKDAWTRGHAVEALVKMGDPAVGPLIAALEDGSWLASSAAVEALGNIRLPAVEPLIAALKDEKRQVRSAAARALGRIGGFHSLVEREVLTVLLRGPAPVIVCPARSLADMRVKPEWREPLAAGRLLLLSAFQDKVHRVTAETALARNRFVASVADLVCIAHAEPRSHTERLAQEARGWGKRVVGLEQV